MEKNDEKLKKILEKLRKLMDLKESALQCGETGEANAAAAGITRLLTEYDLTLQDIPSEQKVVDPIGMEIIPFSVRYMQYPWYWNLLDVVAQHNNADIFRTRYKSGTRAGEVEYTVVGRKKNREVVIYLVSFLANKFVNIGKAKYPEWKLNHIRTTGMTPPPVATYMKNFLFGCVIGLNDKLTRERQSFDTQKITALVRTEKSAIEKFMANMNVKQARTRQPELMTEAVTQGIQEGQNVQIHQGVEQKNTHPDLLS